MLWRPREENKEADALTNDNFGAFQESLMIPVSWASLKLAVGPKLAAEAEEHFRFVQSLREEAKRQATPEMGAWPKRRMARLRERDPW